MVLIHSSMNDSTWMQGGDVAVMTASNRNVTYMLSALGLLCLTGLLGLASSPSYTRFPNTEAEHTLSRLGHVSRTSSTKPVIYRFDRVSNSLSDARRLPNVWDMVWSNAGWIPKKLMVDQLSSQENYSGLKERLQKTALYPIQQRHIHKYLAMACVGGGWLAHGDTFPLNPFGSGTTLPNEGKMTVYDDKFPCLMSATAEEWMRIATTLVEHAETYNSPEGWTEAKALMDIEKEIITVPQVFNLLDAGGGEKWTWNSNDCLATHNMRAVHFLVDYLEDLSQIADPADMVIKWLSMWLQACEQSTLFTDQAESGGRRMTRDKP
jgi:hypothetical protein